MLPSVEVTPAPSTMIGSSLLDVGAVMEEAELTYVVDAEGLSNELTFKSATKLTQLENPTTETLDYTR